MLVALPAFIYLNGIVDPTTVERPGPGDGFVVLLYFLVMVLAGLGYSILAWVLFLQRRRDTPKKSEHLRGDLGRAMSDSCTY